MMATVEGLAKPTNLRVGDFVAILWTGRKDYELYLVQESAEMGARVDDVFLACVNGSNYAFKSKGRTLHGLLKAIADHSTIEHYVVLAQAEWEMVIRRKAVAK